MKESKYYRKVISGFLITGGGFLLLEHLFTWGRFDYFDVWGHETLGLLLIIIGILVSTEKKKDKKD